MVGHDAEAHVVGLVVPVAAAREFLRGRDDWEDLVDFVDVLPALQQVCHALQPHAGVDVLVLEFADDVQVGLGLDVVDLVVLEDEVPDFDVAVVIDSRAAFPAVRRPAIDVDFGAWTAGAGAAGRPEVVLHAELLDVLGGNAFIDPQRARFVVVLEDGDPEDVLVEAVATLFLRSGQQMPGVVDSLLLEVVAEGEVAHHLEEGAMAGGLAHLVDVERAHALLLARHAGARRGLLAQQIRDEGNHARDGEQGCRVWRNQRCRRHDQMSPVFEVA